MRTLGATALLACLMTAVLFAHHSSSQFDLSRTITVVGTLVRVDWRNPHISVSIQTGHPGAQAATWVFESGAPSWFRGRNLSRENFDKAVGQTVTADGVRAKDGSLYGYLYRITFSDGSSLDLR
jgi:uncharacterized protein DUF6152